MVVVTQLRQRELPETVAEQEKVRHGGERGCGRHQGMKPELSVGSTLARDKGLTTRASQSPSRFKDLKVC